MISPIINPIKTLVSPFLIGDFGCDISWFLTVLTIAASLLWLCGAIYRRLGGSSTAMLSVAQVAREFLPSLLLVWILRSFVVQPYRVPSGSLMPTIHPGDFIAVQQYAYGLRWPLTGKVIWPVGQPKRGDLALFHCPDDLSKIYIKRVIGVPGDHIMYRDRELYINGQKIERQWLAQERDISTPWRNLVQRYQEQLGETVHDIYLSEMDCGLFSDVIVPAKHYFMMGDNRDNSLDSRVWGMVPERLLIGKAFAIWMSWDSEASGLDCFRWQRIGLVH